MTEPDHLSYTYAKPREAPPSPVRVAPPALPVKRVLAKTEARPIVRPMKARQRSLLVTELQGLETLLRETRADAADRPTLVRRIAEDYVELEWAAEKDNQTSTAVSARGKAIDRYTMLLGEHPAYPQADEVRFALANEYERANDMANARRVYFDLVRRHPDSRYVPEAYVEFGDLFFDEAEHDPSKWDLARAAYEHALTTPPPRNRSYGYTLYKLAWVEEHRGDHAAALSDMDKAIAFADANPAGSEKLAEIARADRSTLGGTLVDEPVIRSGE